MSPSSCELIITNSPDGPITVFDVITGTVVARFSGSRSPCRGLTTPSRRLIAASHVSSDTGEGSINIYNWFNSSAFHNFPMPEPIAPLIATLDGAFLFGGGISGRVFSLSTLSGDVIRSIVAHSRAVSSLHLSDDGSLVVSGSDDGTIVVVPTFKIVIRASSLEDDMQDSILHKWNAHSDSVTAIKSVMGTLVSFSLDYTCKFWNLEDNGVPMRILEFPCSIFGVALDSTGSRFYAGGGDGLVYKGLVKVGMSRKFLGGDNELSTWSKSHGRAIVSLVLVNEGMNLVSAAEDGSVWMWCVEKEEVIMVLGNDMLMGNISDMIVFKANGEFGVGKGNNNVAIGEGNNNSYGLCDEEMIKTMKQIIELGEAKDMVVQDKKKAIDILESTIEMYERLLNLILKEATKAIEEGEEDEEEEE